MVIAGAIATGIVIALGLAMLVPIFITQPRYDSERPTIMLSFSLVDSNATPEWCEQLSSVLNKHNIKATVFFAGKVADQSPRCIEILKDEADIGSQTYNYVNLTSISDYTLQLEEVRRGKQAVDVAGNLDSRLFRAPYGATDQNIYSLLSRSNITADFSYDEQYNKFYDGKFIKFDLSTYNGASVSPDSILKSSTHEVPLLINFDERTPIGLINNFITELEKSNIRFVDASELTGLDLTVRRGE